MHSSSKTRKSNVFRGKILRFGEEISSIHDRLETHIIARKHLLKFAYYGTFNVHPNTNDAWSLWSVTVIMSITYVSILFIKEA